MIIRSNEMKSETRRYMRGGQGDISLLHYVQSDKIPNGRLMAKVEIPVNGSIGNHEHKNETEYYIILSGNGEVIEDGNISQVNAGDVVVTNNATHGIKNIGTAKLEMIAIIINE